MKTRYKSQNKETLFAGTLNGSGLAAKRGMIIHESKKDNNEPRIFFVNNRNRLFSLNASTGKPIKNFGKNGEIEVGLTPIPPVIYKNQLIIISTSSILKVYDLVTGKLKWKYKINKTKNSMLFPNFEKGSPWEIGRAHV